jgi:hypothetical protein
VTEQAAQIQKVRVQLEASKPAPQIVVGNRFHARPSIRNGGKLARSKREARVFEHAL